MTKRIKAEDLAALTAKPKASKYGNTRVERHGLIFDSKKEADRWDELLLLERAGEIGNLQRQVPIPLNGASGPIKTATGKQAFYLADFTYVDWTKNGVKVVEDAKGFETPEFKLKRAILAADNVEITMT